MHHEMSFYWSSDIGDFFFKGLTINTAGTFAILCIILVMFSMFYEAMKMHSAQVRARAARERQRASSCAPSETANLIPSSEIPNNNGTTITFSKKFWKLFREASLFLVHNIIGYALMLSVMIYNGYLFITVVLGMGLGYFLFGHVSMKINMENIQARTTNVICSPTCPPSQSEETTTISSTNYSTSQGHCDKLKDNLSTITASPSSLEKETTPTALTKIQVLMTENCDIIDSCRL